MWPHYPRDKIRTCARGIQCIEIRIRNAHIAKTVTSEPRVDLVAHETAKLFRVLHDDAPLAPDDAGKEFRHIAIAGFYVEDRKARPDLHEGENRIGLATFVPVVIVLGARRISDCSQGVLPSTPAGCLCPDCASSDSACSRRSASAAAGGRG